MCEAVDVLLVFLPPYSPDFNPIEEAFAELKAWIKKNRELLEIFDTFEEFLREGMEVLSSKAGHHFRRAHIDWPKDMDNDGSTITGSESEEE
jgi:type II restriction/modification system DNA methylase subunit YeeA